MATLFEFIFVLSVAGGFIAWLGDRLGTYIGKKRLSKFGLRPRHTAMLYTILSGVAISILSITALLLYDTNVKRALIEGRKLVAEIHLQKKEKAGLQEQIERQRIAAQRSLDLSTEQLNARQAALSGTQNALKATQGELGAAQGGLAHAKADLDAKSRLLASTDIHLKSEVAQVHAKEKMVADLAVQSRKLYASNIRMANTNVNLLKQNSQLTTEVELSGGPIIYHKQEEIGRREFATNQSPDRLHQQIQSFITTLSKSALKVGLRIGGSGRAVMLSDIKANVAVFKVESNRVEPVKDVALSDKIDEDIKLKALAGSIAELGRQGAVRSVVVVAESHQNTFRGEAAKIDLLPYPNKLIFPRGAEVATGLVDGSQPDNDVLVSLQSFLINQVRPVAKREGIIPRYDPETNDVSYGQQIEIARWLDLVKEIHRIGGIVRVTAIASKDTYSEGPLQLDLLASAAGAQRSQRAMALP